MDDSEQSVPAKKCKTERIDIPEEAIVKTIKKGRLEAIRHLLEIGLDPNRTTSLGTLFGIACLNGQDSVARLLIEKGVPVDASLLFSVCHVGRESIVRLLIEKGVPIDAKDEAGCTPLYWACYNGHDLIAKFLIEKGASVNIPNNDGRAPLYCACLKGRESMARLLIEKGAHVNMKDTYGFTPLRWACYWGHESLSKFLIEKGATITIEILKKTTALELGVDRQIQMTRITLYWIRTRFPDSVFGTDYLPRDMFRLIVRFYIRSEEIAELFFAKSIK